MYILNSYLHMFIYTVAALSRLLLSATPGQRHYFLPNLWGPAMLQIWPGAASQSLLCIWSSGITWPLELRPNLRGITGEGRGRRISFFFTWTAGNSVFAERYVSVDLYVNMAGWKSNWKKKMSSNLLQSGGCTLVPTSYCIVSPCFHVVLSYLA